MVTHVLAFTSCHPRERGTTNSNQVPYAGFCEMSESIARPFWKGMFNGTATYAFASLRAVGLNLTTSGWLLATLALGKSS